MTDPGPAGILPYRAEHRDACAAIFETILDWFGIPEANAHYLDGLAELPSFVAVQNDRVVGFASLRHHFPGSAELEVLAVRRDLHRQGVGRALLDHCEALLRAQGVTLFHVKTLGPSRPDEGYAATRAFYEARGFRSLFETPDLWGPENPALVMLKLLC